MSNMRSAKITIKGTRPLFWHTFGPDAIPLERQERTGVAGNDPEEWRKTVLYTKDGQLYLHGDQAFRALRDGAVYTKKGRGNLQKLVESTLQIVEDRIMIDRFMPDRTGASEPPRDPDEPVYLDVRSVKNPTTKARNIRYRVAAAPGWRATFTIEWDHSIVADNQMEAIAIDTGKLCGIGNGRAIGMGRFAVETFSVQQMD